MTMPKAHIKKLFTTALLMAGFCTQANAAFVGDFAPGNWQQLPGVGWIGSFTEDSLSITSGNVGSESFTDVFIVVPLAGRISFEWNYSTDDDPYFDPFGITTLTPNYLFTELSDLFGAQSQSGFFSLDIGAGQTFSFTAWSLTGNGGSATTRISNFRFETDDPVAEVPEPGTLALLGLGLLGISVSRGRNA